MVTIYHWEGGGLKETPSLTGPCWINLADPSTEEITRVQELTKVPREFLTDPLDKDERPRLEIEEGVTLLIFHVPYHEPHENLIPFHTLPLGIVLAQAGCPVCLLDTNHERSAQVAAGQMPFLERGGDEAGDEHERREQG